MSPSVRQGSAPHVDSRARWTKIALRLVAFALFYNVVEATIATVAGVRADSVALYGFGLDSFIECIAAAAMLWRLVAESSGLDAERITRRDRRVHRFIGGTFFGLAAYVWFEAVSALSHGEVPHHTVPGMVLASVSLLTKPALAWGKLRAAREIGSAALRAEAKESLVCSYLSFWLLLGLVLHEWRGWWWADPLVALAMVPWLLHEGRHAWIGSSPARRIT